jgi:hypothetical protein
MNHLDPKLAKEVERLYRMTVYGRWLFVLFCWMTLGLIGIWGLRQEIVLWFDYFTWSAVRYGLMFNPFPTLCLAFCIAMTTSALIWQSRNDLFGLPAREKHRLEKWVARIRKYGPRHPLWKLVIGKAPTHD